MWVPSENFDFFFTFYGKNTQTKTLNELQETENKNNKLIVMLHELL